MGEAMSLGDILFGSPSEQQSSSSSLQLGGSVASSFGRTGSESTSGSESRSSSTQRVAFEDIFSSLYGGASNAASLVKTGALTETANRLFSGGSDFLQSLTEAGGAGAAELAGRVSDTTARDANLEVLRSGLGDLFSEQFLPAITARGVETGTLGGAREGVQISQAAKEVAGRYATGAADIISSDQAQRDQAAQALASFGAQGLSLSPSLLNLGESGALGGLLPFEALSSIVGGPTVLGESSAEQIARSLASSFGTEGSTSYGFDYGTSESQSTGRGGRQGLAQAFLQGGGLGFSFAA